MPKIDARTVAEHHDLHMSRLLDAALDFVAEHDVDSLTLAELAKRTARSRASLYAYFGSTDEMRIALCAHALTAWVDELLGDVARISNPDDRLDRFIAAQIAHRHEPTVERVLAYVLAQQSEPFRTRLRTVTEPLTTELLVIIERLGVAPPTRAATVVQGAIAAAYDQVRAGANPQEVADDTIAFVRAGLSALRDTSTPRSRPLTQADNLETADASARARPNPTPGALAMRTSPSMPALLATAVPATDATPAAAARPFRTRVVSIAAAQLAWACVGFASGVTGAGGTALHVGLGLSLVAILAMSARVLAPTRVAPATLRLAPALAIAASAVALVARAQQFDAAVVVHVVLAVVLLMGLIGITRSAWRNRHAAAIAPNPL